MIGTSVAIKTVDGSVYQGVLGDVSGGRLSLYTPGLLVRSNLSVEVIEELEAKNRIIKKGYGHMQFTVPEIKEMWLMNVSLEA